MGRGSPCQPHLELKCEHLKLCFSWTAAALSALRELFTEALKKKKVLSKALGYARALPRIQLVRAAEVKASGGAQPAATCTSSFPALHRCRGEGKKTTHTHTHVVFCKAPSNRGPLQCAQAAPKGAWAAQSHREENPAGHGALTFRESCFSAGLSLTVK